MWRATRAVIGVAALLALAMAGAATARDEVDQAALLEPGPLPDHPLGDPGAPVTIVEYASLTCHHCQAFHRHVWPTLKEKYVDTGKVRFILREFPFDTPGAAGFMLAHCAQGKWHEVVDGLFRSAEGWSHSTRPLNALAEAVSHAGMSRQAFAQCLSDQKLLEALQAKQQRASSLFGVRSTPTFFVNGGRHVGMLTFTQLEQLIATAAARH